MQKIMNRCFTNILFNYLLHKIRDENLIHVLRAQKYLIKHQSVSKRAFSANNLRYLIFRNVSPLIMRTLTYVPLVCNVNYFISFHISQLSVLQNDFKIIIDIKDQEITSQSL